MRVAVIGATGNQGRGLISALATNPRYQNCSVTIYAISRDPNSAAAQALLNDFPAANIELRCGDVYDVNSLRAAVSGADALFAMTHNRIVGRLIQTEDEMRHELDAGRNIIEAARDNQVQHFVWSSLPNLTYASDGRFDKVFHFDHKNTIEQWARHELPAVSVLYPGLYYSNLSAPQYCRRLGDGTVRFCAPCPASKSADWVDPAVDIGNFAAEIIFRGPKTTTKTYPVVSRKITFAEMATEFEAVTGTRAYFEPISLDEWGMLVAQVAGNGYERDIRQMIEWIAVAPEDKICYGTMDPAQDPSAELGGRASSFREWLLRTGWKGPLS
ncbi:hypothetical protein BDV59DRAFT_175186 [Aspergillus ambiguus]|uniref:NmrA/HSCARG family protein n=1 Tax=Aspergillus ambiguus TaxID=176160 RepID=UPI003CCDEF3E